MEKRPIKAKGDYRTMCIPCGLHGDEVPVIGIGKIWSRSCLNFSWCSLLANACGGRCEDIMFFLWSVFEKFATASTSTTLGTVDTFFSILKWSFLAMFQGTWPKKDWLGQAFPPGTPEARRAGKPLAGGYYAVLIQLSGDLDYYTKWLGLPNSTTKAKPCGLCRCIYAGSNSWLDNRQVAPWRSSLLSNTNWTTWWSTTCPLLQLPGFFALSFAYDLMHCLYTGALQYIYGSAFFLLTHDCLNLEPLANLKLFDRILAEIYSLSVAGGMTLS